jgi:predicted MFS family arabinose efflux permease
VKASWADLVRGGNGARSAVIGGGIVMHAITVFLVTTILPSVVRDIGGLRFFAWSTTLYVVASLLAGATTSRMLGRLGPRRAYRLALGLFMLGSVLCALAPAMPVLLAGRFVQGCGAGMLSALAYTMVRLLFPEHLWSRAISIVSAMWGVATLLGPALGGFFAEFGAWRAAFWMLALIAPLLAVVVEKAMPADLRTGPAPRTKLATGNLALLVTSVLCVSAGSMAGLIALNILGLALAAGGLTAFAIREDGGARRLLPRRACDPRTRLGATYLAMMLLLIGMTTEIFVPYFLQVLHGATPLHAGYISALMAGGWTVGSLASSSASARAARILVPSGPVAFALGLVGLGVLMPASGGTILLVGIGVCLASVGLGIGMCWPQLGAQVFRSAPDSEKELAAGSITTVIMVGNALGSALGGMVTNLAGLTNPGGAMGATAAASWLFALFAVAPLTALLAMSKFLGARAAVAAE